MSLSTGSHLGPYEILAPLGAGGMGEVYRARDERLKREVAVKVLPPALSSDPDRLSRFEKEAQAAGSLNHPNILAIHDIGTHDGSPYIVSELLEGETLRSRLAAGGIPPRKAIGHAIQIAQGLAAAHERGIVHRDLKPENIFVTPDGRVKILDFGLAKLTQPAEGGAGETNLPTASPGTEPGMVLGTLGYMSPEQVRGKTADARSDIFSFGAILYEMLSDKRAFPGDTAADTISAILTKDPPDLSETNRRIPEGLERIVNHCLEKSAEARFQSARDLAFDLETLSATSLTSGPLSLPAAAAWNIRGRRLLPWLTLPLLLLAYLAGQRATAKKAPARVTQPSNFAQLTFQSGLESFPSLSPDGTSIVYGAWSSGNTDIYLQRVEGRNTINLTKDSDKTDNQPAFSPTGELIAFRSDRDGGGIYLMGATGENVRRLTDFGANPAWSPSGKEIAVSTEDISMPFDRSGKADLSAVDVATGRRRPLLRGEDAVQPSWSPHGSRIAYWGLRGETGQRDIWTIPAEGTEKATPVSVTNDAALDWNPVWSPDGKFLYFASDRGGGLNLWRVAIDERTGEIRGQPEPLTLQAAQTGQFSLSHDGRHLAYQSLHSLSTVQKNGFDSQSEKVVGEPATIYQSSMAIANMSVSPDGQWVAFRPSGGQEDIFLIRSDGTGLRQLMDDAHKDRGPRWSPDGKRIAFYSDRGGRYDIWMIDPDGGNLVQLTKNHPRGPWFPHWSPDGSALAFPDGTGSQLFRLGRTPGEGTPEPFPPLGEGKWFFVNDWSPDGRILAGHGRLRGERTTEPSGGIVLFSIESGKYEWLSDSGQSPMWLNDGRRLLFRDRSDLVLLDARTKRSRIVMPVGQGSWEFAIPKDNRSIYLRRTLQEGDIWKASLE
ncbi:MAG: protein kinase [Thermoanaerobaculia bacterium]